MLMAACNEAFGDELHCDLLQGGDRGWEELVKIIRALQEEKEQEQGLCDDLGTRLHAAGIELQAKSAELEAEKEQNKELRDQLVKTVSRWHSAVAESKQHRVAWQQEQYVNKLLKDDVLTLKQRLAREQEETERWLDLLQMEEEEVAEHNNLGKREVLVQSGSLGYQGEYAPAPAMYTRRSLPGWASVAGYTSPGYPQHVALHSPPIPTLVGYPLHGRALPTMPAAPPGVLAGVGHMTVHGGQHGGPVGHSKRHASHGRGQQAGSRKQQRVMGSH